VITRTTKAWQTDVRKGTPRAPEEDESRFWLLVDFAASPTDFYIVPESWMDNNIYRVHEAFLAEHGGTRPLNPKSTHHSIETERVAKVARQVGPSGPLTGERGFYPLRHQPAWPREVELASNRHARCATRGYVTKGSAAIGNEPASRSSDRGSARPRNRSRACSRCAVG
jgi:hypothetical protein